jgi:hypothetical protein
MDSQTTRKIVVASVMAAVVVIGVVTFALRSHHPVAAVVQTPPPARVAQSPDVPALADQNQEAPAPVPHDNSVGTETNGASPSPR